MAASRLYVHIGTPRTGTTSFQESLLGAESHIDFYLPRTGRDADSFGICHHQLLTAVDSRRGRGTGEFTLNERVVNELFGELTQQAPGTRALISSESLSCLALPDIRRFTSLLPGIEVSAIVCIRDAVEVFRSQWNVRVQNGWSMELNEAHSVLLKDIMYSSCINPSEWRRVLGDSNFSAFRFSSNPQENLHNIYEALGSTYVAESAPLLSGSLNSRDLSLTLAVNRLLTYLDHARATDRVDTWVGLNRLQLRDALIGQLRMSGEVQANCEHFIEGYIVEELRGLNQIVNDTFEWTAMR